MKKVLFALAAVVALAACSKEQTLVTPQPDAIGFDTPFIENATRVTGKEFTSVDSFKVWGDVTGNIADSNADYIFLYNGANVTRNGAEDGAAWTCEQTEYWLPSATYNFMAISGATTVTSATGTFPTTINYTANGTTDLLLSDYVTVTTDEKSNPTGVNSNGCVAFNFNHLLSKVHFKFTNDSGSTNYKFIVKDIKVSGQYTDGIYTIGATTTPWDTTGAGVVAEANAWSFGNAKNDTTVNADFTDIVKDKPVTSNYARLFIPGEQNLTISFIRELWKVGADSSSATLVTRDPITATLTHTPTTPLIFAENGAYVINVSLTVGAPISFTINTLDEWATPEQNITVQ